MNLPMIEHSWDTTSAALHQAVMLLGPIHNAVFPPRNNYLHLPMWITPDGLSGQTLPGGVEVQIDFREGAVMTERPNSHPMPYYFSDHTQRTLFEAVLADLRKDVLAETFARVPEGVSLAEALLAGGKVQFLKLHDLTHDEPLKVHGPTASEYADALYTMLNVFARFRARLSGHLTPIVVWPEHFDLSTLWYADGSMEDSGAQLNFGFAPFSGGLPRPYIYATAYPYPAEMTAPALPDGAYWHTEGWTGAVLPYDELLKHADSVGFAERALADLFVAMRGLLP